MGKKDFFLEDIALDDFSDELGVVERPLSDTLFRVFGMIMALIIGAAGVRILYFGGIRGGEFQSRSVANAGQEMILNAPRGIIYDRYGVPLVTNKPSFSVSINLSEILKSPDAIQSVLDQVNEIIPFDVVQTKERIMQADLERQAYVPLFRNISLESVIELKKLQNRALTIEDGFSREYINSPAFSHLIGFTGLVSDEDLKKDSSFRLNDEIGKMGLELQYDSLLRGINGAKIQFKDARGNAIGPESTNASVGGANIYTTIDAELEEKFYEVMKKRLEDLGRTSGVGIALNPQTGEVLALLNFPDFDNNALSAKLFADTKVLIIGDSTDPRGQRRFARQVDGAVTVEAVDLRDLTDFGASLDLNHHEALSVVAGFGENLMSNFSADDLVRSTASARAGTLGHAPSEIEQAAIVFEDERTLPRIADLLVAINRAGGVRCYRPAVLAAAQRALQLAGAPGGPSFRDATVAIREQSRLVGRPLARRSVGSTLLLKGLEADISVVLNAGALNARNLYVAMTRGSRRLLVCSASPVLNPAW